MFLGQHNFLYPFARGVIIKLLHPWQKDKGKFPIPVSYVDKVPVEEHVGLLDELARLALGVEHHAALVQQRRIQNQIGI